MCAITCLFLVTAVQGPVTGSAAGGFVVVSVLCGRVLRYQALNCHGFLLGVCSSDCRFGGESGSFSIFKCFFWGFGLCAAVTGICGINAWVLVGAGEGSSNCWEGKDLTLTLQEKWEVFQSGLWCSLRYVPVFSQLGRYHRDRWWCSHIQVQRLQIVTLNENPCSTVVRALKKKKGRKLALEFPGAKICFYI